MVRIYMAGPIQHARDNGKGWRAYVKDAHPEIEWVDPMDKYDSTDNDGFDDWQDESAEWTDERIVAGDKEMIRECDAVLIHYEKVSSWGTPREQEYTTHLGELKRFVNALTGRGIPQSTIRQALSDAGLSWPQETPVYVQTTEDEPSPWLTVDAEYVGETFDEVCDVICEQWAIEQPAQ